MPGGAFGYLGEQYPRQPGAIMLKSRMAFAIVVLMILTFCVPISRAAPSQQPACADACPDVPNIDDIDAQQLAAEMDVHPRPELSPIPVDEKTLYGRAYRKVLRETDVYNAPDGQAVGHIDRGLNFVNAGRTVNGWVQV